MSTKINKSANLFHKAAYLFRCPICNNSLKVVHSQSLICNNKHTFDIARQGYVNVVSNPSKSTYSKQLFISRQKIIMNSPLYTSLHTKISEIIHAHIDSSKSKLNIVDIGCGEGSHLHKILENNEHEVNAVGLDISKEAIIMAARNYKGNMWLVSDLANSPLTDHSFHVILNIFSPANYVEFKRMLHGNGIVIKVLPRNGYLRELRESIHKSPNNYNNNHTISLFQKHFTLLNNFQLHYTVELQQDYLWHLAKMTPLSWNATSSSIKAFTNQKSANITIDLDILIGRK